MVLVAKYQLNTRKNVKKRYSFKKKLFALATQKGYDRSRIIVLLRFVHLILRMPQELEVEIKAEFIKLLVNQEPMELTERETMLADALYEAVYGESLEERDRKLLEQTEEQSKAEKLADKTLIARRLLKLGTLTVEQIAKATALPLSAVRSIQQDLMEE